MEYEGMKVKVSILGVGVSFLMVGMAWAGYTTHPCNYDFTLDSAQSSVSFTVWVKQNGVVRDSDSGTVAGSGNVSANLWQTGKWFQDVSQIDLTQMDLYVNGNPSLNLAWWDTTYIIPVKCTVDVTANNLAVHDAGQPASSPVDSAGKFVMPHSQYLAEGTVDYDYSIAAGLYSGSGIENLAYYNDGVTNFVDLAGQVENLGSMVRLSVDQSITGTMDLSSYAPGYTIDYQIDASLVTLPEAYRTPMMGDANFDGRVDVGDLGSLAGNFGQTGMGWAEGDFNFDGSVDVGDLGILAGNYGRSEAALVPEPMTAGLLAMAGVMGLIRRKK
jgi:hypothetical protein